MNTKNDYMKKLGDAVATRFLKELRDCADIPFPIDVIFKNYFHCIGFDSEGAGCPLDISFNYLDPCKVFCAISNQGSIPLFNVRLVYPNVGERSIAKELAELDICLGCYGFELDILHRAGNNVATITVLKLPVLEAVKRALKRGFEDTE